MVNTDCFCHLDVEYFFIFFFQIPFCFCSHSSSSSNSSSKSEPTEVTPNTLINTFPRAPGTSDSIRLKCREMISNALQTGGNPVSIIWTTHFQHRKSVVVGYGRLYSSIFLTFFVFPRWLYSYRCWLWWTWSTDRRKYPLHWV